MHAVIPAAQHPCKQCLKSLKSAKGMLTIIRSPLPHMELIHCDSWILSNKFTKEIETLESTHRCGTHSHSTTTRSNKFLKQCHAYLNILLVHLMVGNEFTLYRLECTGTYVQSNFLTLYAYCSKSLEHCWSKMQAGCRRGN